MATTATMTGAQFDALPYAEGRRWELVQGELIEVSSPTPLHQDIMYAIAEAIKAYFKSNRLEGRALLDVEFALTPEDRVRPDVAVLLMEKARTLDRERVPAPGSPDIAVEIISPTERVGEIQAKMLQYLGNGVTEVWQVYPKSRVVEIRSAAGVRILGPNNSIASDLLPGLTIPVASIFEV